MARLTSSNHSFSTTGVNVLREVNGEKEFYKSSVPIELPLALPEGSGTGGAEVVEDDDSGSDGFGLPGSGF